MRHFCLKVNQLDFSNNAQSGHTGFKPSIKVNMISYKLTLIKYLNRIKLFRRMFDPFQKMPNLVTMA